MIGCLELNLVIRFAIGFAIGAGITWAFLVAVIWRRER